MAASDHLSSQQFEQLDMFKPAKELRGMQLADASTWLSRKGLSAADEGNVKRSRKNVMERKAREAKKSGLHEDIKRNGVQTPVDVSRNVATNKPLLINGHHRVAAAMSIDPKMLVPVTHH